FGDRRRDWLLTPSGRCIIDDDIGLAAYICFEFAQQARNFQRDRSRRRSCFGHGFERRQAVVHGCTRGCNLDGWRVWQPDGRVCRRPHPWLWKPMPYKFNQDRRHKIPKARYRVTNWPEYDAALVRRGHLTVWFTDEAVAAWHAPATGERGGQPIYSDIAIETGLALRLVLHQPLRQTEGALRSIADLLGVRIRIPDHTTFSRRSGGLRDLPKRIFHDEPLHVLVDSTGVKIYGEGEWLDQKHGVRSPRRWRKLHVAVDANTHEIVAVELTVDDVGDVAMIPDLLD